MVNIKTEDNELKLNDSEIKEIMEKGGCLEGFPCLQSRLKDLCRARPYANTELLECLEENPISCARALSYGSVYFCKCNVRNYIAKNMNK